MSLIGIRLMLMFAVLGAPYDFGCQWRSGARMGPRAIREASTLFSFGHGGAYDFEDDITYLPAESTKIVDIGDADIIHTDTMGSHANIEKRGACDPESRGVAGCSGRGSFNQTSLVSMRLMIKSPSMWCRLMRISTLSTNATVSAMGTATPCVVPLKRTM